MREFLRHILTGVDNHTYDIARVLGLLVGVQFLALAGWAVMHNKQAFDPTGYGTGAGLVIAAVSAGIAIKAKTEPK